jgi:exodeoxyribonuclease V beta subunit
LIEGLGAVLETPLGRIGGERRLADIGPADRLSELSFDFRLGEVGNRAKLRAIGRLVVDHLDSSDPLRPWAARLADGAVDLELAGHLTGSIDLVLRLRDADGGQRFVVADYKTNRLTPRGQVPSPDDYAPGRMVVAMEEHDYPLQALLYTVALHRYLRWRLKPYDPASHLGGAAYLFVRGMTGADVATSDHRPHGVLDWSIPASLVVELSSLLDGRPARGGRR